MIVRMAKKSTKRGVTNEKIMEVLINMDGRMTDMNKRMATKDDLEQMKNEIIEPIIKAVDKDAVTVVSHEKRIIVLERKAGVLTK